MWSVAYSHQPLRPYLNYVEQLALSLTCRLLREFYTPDPLVPVLEGFLKRNIDYIDVADKGAYLSGGFMTQCVYGLYWPESDIDIYSEADSVLYFPYEKPFESCISLYPLFQIPDHYFESGVIGDMKRTGREKSFLSFRRNHNFLTRGDLYTLISQDLWEHPQLSYRTRYPQYDSWCDYKEGPTTKIRTKRIEDVTRQEGELEVGNRDYEHLGARLTFIKQLKNWYFGPGGYSGHLRDDGNPKLLKIQNILLTPDWSIEKTIGRFDINLCQLYFDGRQIKFHNLNDFFRGTLNYQLLEADQCSGNMYYFHRQTYQRLKKYKKRFIPHYPQSPLLLTTPQNLEVIRSQLFTRIKEIIRDYYFKEDPDENYPPGHRLSHGFYNDLPTTNCLFIDDDEDSSEEEGNSLIIEKQESVVKPESVEESSEKKPEESSEKEPEKSSEKKPDYLFDRTGEETLEKLEEKLSRYPEPFLEFCARFVCPHRYGIHEDDEPKIDYRVNEVDWAYLNKHEDDFLNLCAHWVVENYPDRPQKSEIFDYHNFFENPQFQKWFLSLRAQPMSRVKASTKCV